MSRKVVFLARRVSIRVMRRILGQRIDDPSSPGAAVTQTQARIGKPSLVDPIGIEIGDALCP
jgi:hypothetical protein